MSSFYPSLPWALLGFAILSVVRGVVVEKSSKNGVGPRFNNVYVLDNDNHKAFIADPDNDKVLLIFYSPFCHYSARYVPEFQAAAMELGDSNVKLAQVQFPCAMRCVPLKTDNVGQVWVAWDYSIDFPSRYPHLVYFEDGQPTKQYTGGKEKREIIAWVLGKN